MSILQQFLFAIAQISAVVLSIFFKLLFAVILLNWLEAFGVINTYNKVVRFISDTLHTLTDWYLNFFRRMMPPTGPVDFSPLIAFLLLYFLQIFLPRAIYTLAASL